MRLVVVICAFMTGAALSQARDTFDERFNGDGPYSSNSGRIIGLDNPGWSIRGSRSGDIRDDGLAFSLGPRADRTESQLVARNLIENCGFKERIELRNYYQGPVDSMGLPSNASEVSLYHYNVNPVLMIRLDGDDNLDPSDWSLAVISGETVHVQQVPVGENIALEIHYRTDVSQASFVYDNDIFDDAEGYRFGPFYASDSGISTIFYAVAGGFADISGILDNWSYVSLCDSYADFDQSGAINIQDIDLLSAEVRAGTQNPTFDLNGDTLVNDEDRVIWVRDFNSTYFGDANLDSQFDSQDLTLVFQAGQYEDAMEGNSTWATGDWNADAEFTSSDLVVSFQDGGYEQGPRPAQGVPEPNSSLLTLAGVCALLWWRRRS